MVANKSMLAKQWPMQVPIARRTAWLWRSSEARTDHAATSVDNITNIIENRQDQDFTIKFNTKKLCFLSKSESRWRSGSEFYFDFQYLDYILYVEDTHQILFGSANSFES